MKSIKVVMFSVVMSVCTASVGAGVLFQDVSQSSGIVLQTQSFGAGAWGDYNGDGLPDLWLGNHGNPPSLFVNQGDGTFIDVASQAVQPPLNHPSIDAHGAQWADIDRDGDQDLVNSIPKCTTRLIR